jgi:Arc/MetJ-type ribon-helix-helix transcriptional regulator
MTDENNKKDEEQESKGSQKNVFEELGDSVGKFATRTMESIKKSIDKAMDSRNTVLTIRVNDEANHKMNMLVDSGIFKSRSESAAFLIEEGIKKQEALFKKISGKMDQINKLKEELKTIMSETTEESGKKK